MPSGILTKLRGNFGKPSIETVELLVELAQVGAFQIDKRREHLEVFHVGILRRGVVEQRFEQSGLRTSALFLELFDFLFAFGYGFLEIAFLRH